MATVSEQVKKSFGAAKLQFVELEKKVGELPQHLSKAARDSIEDVPQQLKGAWDHVVERLRGALDYASREDLEKLGDKVEDLAKKVEKLIRGEKIRAAASGKDAKPAAKR
jgi:hypothetical protein